MKKTAHVISHTHWDREWYMPYEKHHVRLVRLMDQLLHLLKTDASFAGFHLDGQTIILDDYLQVRPEQREEVIRRVREGRIRVGPWYILQDEFLTSSEANVRNLLIGFKDAKQYGGVTRIGYFPDSFGNMGQAPQLLRQAGIDVAVFGRGVKPVGFNNQVADASSHESVYSEMIWQSPDGSEVLGILFANWYHNGLEIPADAEHAAAYWAERLHNAEKFASTPHLLFMNGSDHQPIQTDLTAALETARTVYPEVEFVHSDFETYASELKKHLPADLTTIAGELRSLQTDGWMTLVNTASARVYIKQANWHCQMLLEKVAEPMRVLAARNGADYPHHLLEYAWKTLMQNHPHDSICGCSVDEVHREMMVRFDKALHVTQALVEESAAAAVAGLDTTCFADFEGAIPFVVFNAGGWNGTGVVSVELITAKEQLNYDHTAATRSKLAEAEFMQGQVIDADGSVIACEAEDLGVQFGYDLPEDKFRQPYFARRIRIRFYADALPAMGYRLYAWQPYAREPQSVELVTGVRSMANEWLDVKIEDNGSITMTDKITRKTYRDLGIYENTGDIGNEYMYKAPQGIAALTTHALQPEITLKESNSVRAAFEIVHSWEIPAEAEALLQDEVESMVPFKVRRSGRSDEVVILKLHTEVALERHARKLDISVNFENTAKDHRLRMLLPADVESASHLADSIFELARRDNEPAPVWDNPSYCQHQQCFAAVDNDQFGLMVATMGLNEYEVLRDGRNTLAVTLLRAVRELGDWGVFPTPEAQCQGKQQARLSLIPYAGANDRYRAAREAYQYGVPWVTQQLPMQTGKRAPQSSWLDWQGDKLALSAVKLHEQSNDYIVRWFNMSDEPSTLRVQGGSAIRWFKSNILEERLDELPSDSEGRVQIEVGPAEIVTLRGLELI